MFKSIKEAASTISTVKSSRFTPAKHKGIDLIFEEIINSSLATKFRFCSLISSDKSSDDRNIFYWRPLHYIVNAKTGTG